MVGGSDGSTNQCAAIGINVASLYDVKATILKEIIKKKIQANCLWR